MAVVLALELVQQLRKEMAGVLQLKSRRECPQMGQNVPPSVTISSHSPWVQLDSICSSAGMKFVERAGSPVRDAVFARKSFYVSLDGSRARRALR